MDVNNYFRIRFVDEPPYFRIRFVDKDKAIIEGVEYVETPNIRQINKEQPNGLKETENDE